MSKKCKTRKLLKPNSFLTECRLAKQCKLALIYFKESKKYWSTAIPDFYLKGSKTVEFIKQF